MALSVVARILGDDYQARWFWFQACRLFSNSEVVESVSYEIEKYKGFDDVAIKYGKPVQDGRGS